MEKQVVMTCCDRELLADPYGWSVSPRWPNFLSKKVSEVHITTVFSKRCERGRPELVEPAIGDRMGMIAL